jgi:hypothetical protein
MDPITILSLANGALTVVEALIPKIAELFQKGEITAAQQQEVLAKYQSLKAKADGQFSGPEWAA